MDGDITVSIIVLAILTVISGYFSATETAFSSLNKIRIKNMAAAGNKRAGLVMRMSLQFERMLSTVLIGNNIVNIAATSIATVLFTGLLGSMGPAVSTVVMTVVILIFGEVSPKTLAKENPEGFAMFSAPPLRVLMVILTPFNAFFSLWKKLLAKIVRTGGDASITEEELLTLVDEAQQEGAIEEEDRSLIRSVIEFNDSRVEEILTPRVDVVGVEVGESMDEAASAFLETGYTRLPVYEGNLDKITGAVHLRDFFESVRQGTQINVADIQTPVIFTTPHTKISVLLKLLQQSKGHMAVVADEYGGTMGIVTMEDILEELVGEIWDEHDEIVHQVQKQADDSYCVMGSAEVSEVFDILGISAQTDAVTVSGWIAEMLNRIPSAEDVLEHEQWCVRVMSVHQNRVDKCCFSRINTPDEE